MRKKKTNKGGNGKLRETLSWAAERVFIPPTPKPHMNPARQNNHSGTLHILCQQNPEAWYELKMIPHSVLYGNEKDQYY